MPQEQAYRNHMFSDNEEKRDWDKVELELDYFMHALKEILGFGPG